MHSIGKRRDRVCAQLHSDIRKEKWVKSDNRHQDDPVPKSVKTSHEGNQQFRTDRTIPNNNPAIIIRDDKK